MERVDPRSRGNGRVLQHLGIDIRCTSAPSALFSHENQIQGENSPPPETGGGEFLPEFDFMILARSAVAHVHRRRGGCSFYDAAFKPTASKQRSKVIMPVGRERSKRPPQILEDTIRATATPSM